MHIVHSFGDPDARFEMMVLPDARNPAIVTLDKHTGDLRYIYQRADDVPPGQYAVELKAGTSYGQVIPAARKP